jgi:hypothetical protein
MPGDEVVDAPIILLNVSVETPVVRGQKSAAQSWPEANASSIVTTREEGEDEGKSWYSGAWLGVVVW